MRDYPPQPRIEPCVEPSGSLKDAHGRGAAISLPSSSELRAEKVPESSPILGDALPEVASSAPGCEPGVTPASPASAVGRSVLSRQVARPADAGRVFLYRWAGVKSRVDAPSVAELVREGWEIEHVDERYGTHLMRISA